MLDNVPSLEALSPMNKERSTINGVMSRQAKDTQVVVRVEI